MIEFKGVPIQTQMGLCGVHIERSVVDAYSKKIKRSAFGDVAKADISMLRNNVASQIQFKTLAIIVQDEWKRLGEHEFAKTFLQEYLQRPYDFWSINSFPEAIASPCENQTVEASHRTDKRDNLGAGARNKVGLSEYAISSIPVLLKRYTDSHSGRSITVQSETIATGFPMQTLYKALKLLEQIVDERVKSNTSSSQSKSPSTPRHTYVSNFEHVPIGSTIVQKEPKSVVGYIVFNSHTQFVQDYGASKDVTRVIALQVIDSALNGRFPKGLKYEAITTFVKGYHLMTYEVVHKDGTAVYKYKCTCKAGRSEGECSHEAASEEINKTFCVKDQGPIFHTVHFSHSHGTPIFYPVPRYFFFLDCSCGTSFSRYFIISHTVHFFFRFSHGTLFIFLFSCNIFFIAKFYCQSIHNIFVVCHEVQGGCQ